MKEIKKNYKPVYSNIFGKVRVDPTRKEFFKKNEEPIQYGHSATIQSI
jgi:hypothetical protein